MRHRVAGKQLSRTTSHRKAMRRNMAASLIEHGAIRTTEAKAKELRGFVERLITIAKKGTLHGRRRVVAKLGDRAITDGSGEPTGQTIVQKLFDEVAGHYVDRPGGYTRIIRLDERRIGDAGVQVILQLVEEGAGGSAAAGGKNTRRKRSAAKRHSVAAQAGVTKADQVQSDEVPDGDDEDQDAPAADDAEGAEDADETDEPDETDEKK